MTKHGKHKSCGATEKAWLPYEFEDRSRGLRPHSYCIHCGVVQNISSDRAKQMGYYINILAKMPITKVQMRLIVKELEYRNFDNIYFMTGAEQRELFSSVVQKYCNVS